MTKSKRHSLMFRPNQDMGFEPRYFLGRYVSPSKLQRLSNLAAGKTTTLKNKEISMKRHFLAFAVAAAALIAIPANLSAQWTDSQYLGRLSANPYAVDSAANPYGQYGSNYSTTSINNPYSQYGSPYSPYSATNPYATNAPRIYASDGTYLGKLSANRYDPDSVSNQYGRYGSPYSSTSINNPYSQYGSPYSTQSPNNPYTTSAPIIVSGDDDE